MTTMTPAAGMTRLPAAGTNWQASGLCRQVDPDLWFPGSGDPTAAAKRICARCDVRLQCMEWAVEHGERGIWGGTTDNQRKAIRKARDQRPTRAEAA